MPRPDTRPMCWISTHGAPRSDENPFGLRRALREDPLKFFMDRFSSPYRRFLVHQPGGWLPNMKMGAAHYYTVDETVMSALRQCLQYLPAITVGIYGGAYVGMNQFDRGGRTYQDPDNPHDVATQFSNMLPWTLEGVKEYWWDAGSIAEYRTQLYRMADRMRAMTGLRIGSEALGLNKVDGKWYLDKQLMGQMPLICNWRFVEKRWPIHNDVDNDTYEAIVVAHRTSDDLPPEPKFGAALLKKGFVLGGSRIDGPYHEALLEAYAIADRDFHKECVYGRPAMDEPAGDDQQSPNSVGRAIQRRPDSETKGA